MTINYTEEEWKVKIDTWLKYNNVQYYTFNNYTVAYIFGIVFFIQNIIERQLPSRKFVVQDSPSINQCDDYTLKKYNGLYHSSKMSLKSFYNGAINLAMSSSYLKYGKPTDLDVYIEKYFLASQDFILKDGVFKTHLLYENTPKISVKDNRIYIDNKIFDKCSLDEINRSLYQITILQQQYSHGMICHTLPVYIFNLFKSCKIDELIVGNQVIDTIIHFGKDHRDNTEGVGRLVTGTPGSNSLNLDMSELECLRNVRVKLLESDLIFKNLYEKALILEDSKNVYDIFRETILLYITDEELQIIQDALFKSRCQVVNCIVNSIYVMTYYHGKSHYILNYIKNYTKNKANDVLVNSFYLQSHQQRIGINDLMKLLKIKTNSYKKGEGEFVFNAHANI